MTNETLFERFKVEHFDRDSISYWRRHQTLVVLSALATQLDGRTLAELTPSDLMAWQAAELKRGIAPSTMGKHESMVGAFLRWASTAGLISFEQMAQLKSVRPVRGAGVRSRPKPYKASEIEAFRQILAERYPFAPTHGKNSRRLARYQQGRGKFDWTVKRHARRLQLEAQVSLALEEGLRFEEIRALTIPRMHPDNAAVLVFTIKSRPGEIREREVPWTSHSRNHVRDWLDFRDTLAVKHESPWLALMTHAPLAEQTRVQCKESLPRPYSWHRFRHTFATTRLRAGMSLDKVQVMMGHALLQNTLAYAEIVHADVAIQAAQSEAEFCRLLGLETP